MSTKTKLAEILAEKGLPLSFQYGGKAPENEIEREVKKEPTPRAKKLRDIYYNTLSTADMEFPYWYTRRWNELEGEVDVVRRAESLKSAFSHLTPNIIPGEKLVMQKTVNYRGSFPMPWLAKGYFASKEDELYQEGLNRGSGSAGTITKYGTGGGNVVKDTGKVVSRAGKFALRQEHAAISDKLAREWAGRAIEDLSYKYEQMVPEYKMKENLMKSVVCYWDSGFTIPMGREVINYFYPLQYGFDGMLRMVAECREKVAGNAGGDGLIGMDRMYFYEAVKLVIEGLQNWILNYAKHARELAESTKDSKQKGEYIEISDCLEWIAHFQPRTFREALQLTYTVHIAAVNEEVISGMSPGRMGQVWFPWFEQDMEAGRIKEEEVLELLELYRVKMSNIDSLYSNAISSNTFNNLCVGGLKKNGTSAVNKLEYLIVEAGIRCVSTQPTLTCLYDEKLPEDFLLKCIESNKTGSGYPAWINNRVAMDFLLRQFGDEGMNVEEARAIAIGGCLETSPCCWKELTLRGRKYDIPGGAGQPTSVGVHFMANPKILNLVLMNGKDDRLDMQVFPAHNKKLETYEELWEQYKEYYAMACDIITKTSNIQHDLWRKKNMSVLNSMLKPDCLDKGQHIGNLGYRYNATYNIESSGTNNLINSLAALKKLVYDDKKYTLDQITEAILHNFGFKVAEEIGSYSLAEQEKADDTNKYDEIYIDCLRVPKYGNDDPYVDNILYEYENWFCNMAHNFESLYGKKMYVCQISVSSHGPLGAVTLATPDGRLAGTTFTDGSMSAYPGTDRNGPYALFESATGWDHSMSQNSQMNLKVHPSSIKGVEGAKKFLELTRSYMRKGGFHIQYNVVDSKVLKTAQKKPENYRDLAIRVAGFTQFWCEVGKPIQDEVIARTEYEGV